MNREAAEICGLAGVVHMASQENPQGARPLGRFSRTAALRVPTHLSPIKVQARLTTQAQRHKCSVEKEAPLPWKVGFTFHREAGKMHSKTHTTLQQEEEVTLSPVQARGT